MRRILVTGKNGQVGWELQRTLLTLGEVIAVDRATMDLADPDSIRKCIRKMEPDVIVNAAAYTAVDKAESEPEFAMAINGIAPGIMAEEAKRLGSLIIHYSTDYVFDGTKKGPYTEDDKPNPLNVYGKTKLAGEISIKQTGGRHVIFRTSWIYGVRGRNFLRTILSLAKEQEELRVVDDQIGAPTWSRTIAEVTGQFLATRPLARGDRGETGVVYNLSSTGETSWFKFAQIIFARGPAIAGLVSRKLVPITSADYRAPATRPKNSRLDSSKLMRQLGIALPGWDRCVDLCLEELTY